MQKIGEGNNARVHPKFDECIIQRVTTKMGFDFNHAEMCFYPEIFSFGLSVHLFQQRFEF